MKFRYKLSLPDDGLCTYCAHGAELDFRIQAELRDAARLGYQRTVQDFKVEVIASDKTILQRIRAVAVELKELASLIQLPGSDADAALFAILGEEYDKAIAICDGNYEPPDPPGWEGGFAENH